MDYGLVLHIDEESAYFRDEFGELADYRNVLGKLENTSYFFESFAEIGSVDVLSFADHAGLEEQVPFKVAIEDPVKLLSVLPYADVFLIVELLEFLPEVEALGYIFEHEILQLLSSFLHEVEFLKLGFDLLILLLNLLVEGLNSIIHHLFNFGVI